jgi:hypothetical protein
MSRWRTYTLLSRSDVLADMALVRAAPPIVVSASDRALAPQLLDLSGRMLGVRDQEKQGACVAMCFAQLLEWFKQVKLSPQFIFDLRRISGQSMLVSDAASICSESGVCLESSHPYGKPMAPADIATAVYAEALHCRLPSASNCVKHDSKVDSAVDDLKQILLRSGPCMITVPVYNFSSQPWLQRSSDGGLQGFHQLIVMGYNDVLQHFNIRNSWGTDWAAHGDTLLPYDQLAKVETIYELINLAQADPILPTNNHNSSNNNSADSSCAPQCCVQ